MTDMRFVGELLKPENENHLYEVLWSIEVYLWKTNKLKDDLKALEKAYWSSGGEQ